MTIVDRDGRTEIQPRDADNRQVWRTPKLRPLHAVEAELGLIPGNDGCFTS